MLFLKIRVWRVTFHGQVISCCGMIVFLLFKTVFKIFIVVSITNAFVHYLVIQMLTIIELVLSIRTLFYLLIPRMCSNLINSITLIRISIQNSCKHINSRSRQPLWNFIISSHNFLIKFWSNWIFKRQVPTNHCI